MGDKLRPLFRDLLAILLLWALIVAFFWRIALAGQVLAGGDIFTYFYPYWAEAARALRAVRLPLWNPYLFMGVPFLANSQVGFFYPLNWPLWLLLPAYRAVHLTLVLHLCLAALNGYLWGRASLRQGQIGAWAVGAVFALGGYLGAQVEHVNQLQGLAWLPLMLVLWDRASKQVASKQVASEQVASEQRGKWAAGLSLVIGLVLLAGHTQTAFISLVGLAAYGLGPAAWRALRRREWQQLARRALLLAGAVGFGVTLAAVQLIPTWELTRLSVRAGGLPFNERVSFSLAPSYLARALLPAFAETIPPAHMEHVAYIGITGLALAAAAISHLHSPIPHLRSVVLLVVLGLFLSLGFYNPLYLILARYVPGFAHFRVPARWLTLYVIGAAALAGWGADRLWNRRVRLSRRALSTLALALIVLAGWAALGERTAWPTIAGWALGIVLALGLLALSRRAPRRATVGLLAVLVVELFAAGRSLPYSRATAPQAFTGLRPAIAHLLTAGGVPPARFISMSDITFDPGDLPAIETVYGPQLPANALYDYIVAAKQKEVLSPDLPLAFGIPAVDGYDGGLLPLARYVTLQRLFLPDDQVSIDGRLRENLTTIPAGRWLDLFDARYVITDKLHDAWLDDVFYDLQFGAQLSNGEPAAVAYIPRFEATALGLVAYLRGGEALPSGAPVGLVEVGFGAGLTRTFELRAGEEIQALHGPEEPVGSEHAIRLRWPEPAIPTAVVVRAVLPEGELVVRGASLIDERTNSFQSLVLSDQGRFRLAHSGDVKIYENLDVLGRAFFVGRAVAAAGDEEALASMQDQTFDPATTVVLDGSAHPRQEAAPGMGQARVVSYTPERVEIEVESAAPGYLVLSDSWYPGWSATVDGEPTPVYRADLLFRAVAVEAGRRRVIFTFRPLSLWVGAGVSLAGLIGLGLMLFKGKRGDIIKKPGFSPAKPSLLNDTGTKSKEELNEYREPCGDRNFAVSRDGVVQRLAGIASDGAGRNRTTSGSAARVSRQLAMVRAHAAGHPLCRGAGHHPDPAHRPRSAPPQTQSHPGRKGLRRRGTGQH